MTQTSYGLSVRSWVCLVALAALSHASVLAQASNPLGVEWVGGSSAPAPVAPAPSGSNPLGVNWVGGTPTSAPPPAAPAPATNNPLGVEWVGGSSAPAPVAPAPTGSNPLGIEWRTGVNAGASASPAPNTPQPVQPPTSPSTLAPAQPVTPQPVVPQPVAPQPTVPEPVRPDPAPTTPQPAPPQTPVTPAPGAGANTQVAALVDTWKYLAVAFADSRGTISETRGVSGSLEFKPNGEYKQALYIGTVLNALEGTYRVSGGRLEMTYLWWGQPTTDVFEVYLDPAGKKLTLRGTGSPQSLYTLERTE